MSRCNGTFSDIYDSPHYSVSAAGVIYIHNSLLLLDCVQYIYDVFFVRDTSGILMMNPKRVYAYMTCVYKVKTLFTFLWQFFFSLDRCRCYSPATFYDSSRLFLYSLNSDTDFLFIFIMGTKQPLQGSEKLKMSKENWMKYEISRKNKSAK